MASYWTDTQKSNLEYFQNHLEEYLKSPLFKGKFLVIHDEEIQHTSDTFEGALAFAVGRFAKEEFVIQQVIGSNEVVSFLRSAVC